MMQSCSGENDLAEKTIYAEVLHTNFIAQHNISLLTADHLSPLYAKMFPDPKIAKSRRTKSSCILRDAMYPILKTSLVEHMTENPFSLVHDGSSDSGFKKMNAACALIFDVNNSKYVEIKFYDMCATSGEDCCKAAALFDAIDVQFIKDGIDWENLVCIGLDNTNTNMGNKNSVKSRVLDKNSDCFIAGCNCHLSHLAACKGRGA